MRWPSIMGRLARGGAVMLPLMLGGMGPAAAQQDAAVLDALGLSGNGEAKGAAEGAAEGAGADRPARPEIDWGGVFQYRAVASRPGDENRAGYASMATLRLTSEATYGALRGVAHVNVEDWRASRPWLMQSLVENQGQADRIRSLALREHDSKSLQSLGMDWLYVQASFARARVTVGRQPVSLTLSRLWSPADTYAPFLPGDVERLYKAGVDAARLDYYVTDRVGTQSIVSGSQDGGGATRAKWLQRIEYGGETSKSFFSVGQRRNCDLASAGALVTGVADVDWYGEALAFRGRDSRADSCSSTGQDSGQDNERGGWGHRAVLGASRKLAPNTIGTLEYFHQTQVSRQADLPWLGSGRQYLGASISYQAHPLVHVDGLWFVNLTDRGQQLTLAMRYTPQRNVVLRASVAGPLTGTGRRDGVASEYWRQGRVAQLGLDWYF